MRLQVAVSEQPNVAPSFAEQPGVKDLFCPSAHTGLVLQALHQRAAAFNKGSGLDVGVGSGVLLAALGSLGVKSLTGSDIDLEAVRCTEALLASHGFTSGVRLINGSMWDELDGRVFDVITANLPAFPASGPCDPDHSPHWSCGGPDGRNLMDPFLAGLPGHLAADGVAFIAHNVFLDRARTDAMLRDGGLSACTLIRTTIPLDARKASLMNPAIRRAKHTAGLSRFGGYEFMDVEVLEIRRARPTGAASSQ